jgi:hypothetical protein
VIIACIATSHVRVCRGNEVIDVTVDLVLTDPPLAPLSIPWLTDPAFIVLAILSVAYRIRKDGAFDLRDEFAAATLSLGLARTGHAMR